MANKKYTDGGLASASPLDGTERWGVARGGGDKYVTTSMFPAYLGIRARLDNSASPFNNIAIPNATLTALALDHLAYDTGGFYSVSHPTRLTAPVACLCLITVQVEWASTSGSGLRQINLYLNGSNQIAVADDGLTTHNTPVEQNLTIPYLFAANDYVEAKVYQTSGGSLNILQETNYSPVFSIVRIG